MKLSRRDAQGGVGLEEVEDRLCIEESAWGFGLVLGQWRKVRVGWRRLDDFQRHIGRWFGAIGVELFEYRELHLCSSNKCAP